MGSVIISESVKVKNSVGTIIDPAIEHILANSPHAVRLTDGITFYKGTTPSDTQPISASSLPLPTGAASQATLATLLLESTFIGRIGEVQSIPTANTVLDRLKSINDNLIAGILITGTVTANLGTIAGVSTEATLSSILTELGQKTEPANNQNVIINAAFPAGSNTIGAVNRTTVASSTITQVSASASSVQLLASNASAKKRHVFNFSNANLYIKEGASASTSSFTVRLEPFDYYEFPEPLYTGIVHGIWDSATGSALVTES